MAWPVSPRFDLAVATSHEVVTKVDVWHGGVLVREDLPVLDGSVRVSETAKVRRELDIAVPRVDPATGASLVPRDEGDLLAPFGTELAVSTGVRTAEGAVELVPVGRFRVTDAGPQDVTGPVQVSGADRGHAVAAARFLQARSFAGAKTAVAEITGLLLEVDPAWEVYDLTRASGRASTATIDRDRWEAIDMMAAAVGAEVVPDPEGRWLIRPVPQVPTLADADAAVAAGWPRVWVWQGGDGGSLLDLGGTLTSDNVYNAVVVTGEVDGVAAPVVGVARLSSGPLAWDGPLGPKPRFFSSPFVRSVEQAQAAAEAMLPRFARVARDITPTVLPHPAVDVGDWAIVVDPDDGSRTPAIVHEVTLSLLGQAMTVQVRVADQVATGGEL